MRSHPESAAPGCRAPQSRCPRPCRCTLTAGARSSKSARSAASSWLRSSLSPRFGHWQGSQSCPGRCAGKQSPNPPEPAAVAWSQARPNAVPRPQIRAALQSSVPGVPVDSICLFALKAFPVFRIDGMPKSGCVAFLPHHAAIFPPEPLPVTSVVIGPNCRRIKASLQFDPGRIANVHLGQFEDSYARPARRCPPQAAQPDRLHPPAGLFRIPLRQQSSRRLLPRPRRRSRASPRRQRQNPPLRRGGQLRQCSRSPLRPAQLNFKAHPSPRSPRYSLAPRHAPNHALPHQRRPPLGPRNPRYEGRCRHGVRGPRAAH